MNSFRIATLIVAPLFVCGCFSTPKEKTEYERQIEAVPMPASEADRLEQCGNSSESQIPTISRTCCNTHSDPSSAPRIMNIPRLKRLGVASEP